MLLLQKGGVVFIVSVELEENLIGMFDENGKRKKGDSLLTALVKRLESGEELDVQKLCQAP